MVHYSPLTYYTYNSETYYASIGASILYFVFYIILFLVFKYELYNKRGFCTPMFYYGQACRNEIANTILSDPGFVQAKQTYYTTVKNTTDAINGTMVNDQYEINNADALVNDNLNDNANFTNATIGQIQEATNVLKMIASKYLGNMQTFVASTKNQSTEMWQQLQSIPPLLGQIQNQINTSIVVPALMPYTDPLRKLYNSLSEVQTIGENSMTATP